MKQRRLTRTAFTLVELLVVIVIVAVLIGILFPVINRMILKSYETKTIANLKNHSVAFSLFAADNNNDLPSASVIEGQAENAYSWWIYRLKPFFTKQGDTELGQLTHDPYYYKLLNEPIVWWRPGWSMNGRMGLAVGDGSGIWSRESSNYKQYKITRYPQDTILLGPGYWNSFEPKNDGTVEDSRFSDRRTDLVPHNRRIGANKDGLGGNSAFYLTVSGSALNLTPAEAAKLLKLRPAM